jgi:hypothetical protein
MHFLKQCYENCIYIYMYFFLMPSILMYTYSYWQI